MEAFTNEAIRGYIIANTWQVDILKLKNYKKSTKGHIEVVENFKSQGFFF